MGYTRRGEKINRKKREAEGSDIDERGTGMVDGSKIAASNSEDGTKMSRKRILGQQIV